MQELVEQILIHIRGAWRYRWHAMVLIWVIALAGWTTVFFMPDRYEASARVYVDTDSLLRPLLRGLAVQTNLEQRVRLMTRTLLSRQNLEKIAHTADMDLAVHSEEEMDELIKNLKKNIHLSSSSEANLYVISYQHYDPKVAKKVVTSLLNIFVEDTLGETRQDSETAQQFLDQQIREYESKLTKAENRLKDFKRQNIDILPDSEQNYYQQLQTARHKLDQARLELKEAQNKRSELKRQLSGEEPVFGIVNSDDAVAASNPLKGRIQSLQTRLDELLLKYTDQHPEVIAIREKIALLKKQLAQEVQDMKAKGISVRGDLDQNPVYQQMKIALAQAEVEVSSLTVRVNKYEEEVTRLRRLVNTGPEIEAQLKRLNRDYEINKQNYQALVERRESAILAESAGKTGDDVKFRVIDPPRVPALPAAPNRLLLNGLVLLLGVAAGLAVAWAISQIRPTFYDQRTLRNLTGVPVFGVVSRLWTAEQITKRRVEYGAFALVSFMLLFAFSGVLYINNGIQWFERLF
jgi:polysaccharide chain length determinant protein (PEP-CTERM system associated)